jgi:ribosome biogenesis GTPase
VWVVSAVTGVGVAELRARVAVGRTAVLVGSSGVGKSTLVNAWLGREAMATRETRADDDEGRHTTTHRELMLLPGGGMVIDTPGIRELQLWAGGAGGAGGGDALEEAFADVEELAAACKFNDCGHASEPGCAIRAALADGSLARDRYASWQKLQRELRSIAIRADARLRKEERKRWHQLTRDARARTRHR